MNFEFKYITWMPLLLCLSLLFGCASTPSVDTQSEKTPAETSINDKADITDLTDITEETSTEPLVREDETLEKGNQSLEISDNNVLAPIVIENDENSIPEPITPEEVGSPGTEQTQTDIQIVDTSKPATDEDAKLNTQELLDSALDYCQTSNEFWEQGDLDNAIDALDKAYSLILKMNGETDPELLRQREDLRFTISKRIIEVYSSRFTVASGTYKAIPLEMNDQVEKALALFKGRERESFIAAYQRSGMYRPDIVKALQEAGLPEELSWLPLIESGFKVRALSRARALGMWQFIASTGYRFGLKRDTYIDERMDPEKSTQAAIAYLTELHNIFGDWTTALAAYNCGAGRVLNRIKSQRINYLDNFWDLYHQLPTETAFYVPKFLAVLHIINDPETHGFVLPEVDEKVETEEVTINRQVHLQEVAGRLGVSYTSMKDLNPELRHNQTPNRPYALKIPVGKKDVLLAVIEDIPVYQPPVPPYVVHRVRYGESLSVIADRYNTSVTAIMNMNGLRSRNYVKVGWRLKIPTKSGYAPSSLSAGTYKGETTNYTVKKGDSLWKIADRYQTTVISIKTINNLQSSELQIGQILRIPSVETITLSGNTKSYTVRRGESPYLIARKFRMNLHDFLQMNNLTPKSKIYPGQLVLVSTK